MLKNESLVYEIEWLLNAVYNESDRLLNEVTDTTMFERRCLESLGDYLALSETHLRNKRYLIRLIKRKTHEAITTNRKECATIFSDIRLTEEYEDSDMTFEPADNMTNVEEDVIVRDLVANMAVDKRSRIVLESWVDGNFNVSSIARILTKLMGGNVEAHRKYIQRFRRDCREYLSG